MRPRSTIQSAVPTASQSTSASQTAELRSLLISIRKKLHRERLLRLVAEGRGVGGAVEAVPRLGGGEVRVHVFDIFHALIGEPIFEGLQAGLGVDGHRILPRGAPAEDARKRSAGFGGEIERLSEHVIRNARRKIDERLARRSGGFAEKIFR